MRGINVQFFAHTPLELRGLEYRLSLESDFLKVLTCVLGSGDVFLDVGSHIGQFIIPLAKLVGEKGQVIAFEPDNEAFARLQEHLKLNEVSNVRTFKKALGEQNSTGRLFVGGTPCPSLLPHRGDAEQQGAVQDVDIVQGDWFRESERLPTPRAVKIDVEGYESAVLCGLKRTLAHPACELLCVEIHPTFLPPEVTVEALLKFVKSRGFTRLEAHPRQTEIHVIATKGATKA